MPLFGVILVRIFPHSDWCIQSECGKMRTRITPNTDTFYAVNIYAVVTDTFYAVVSSTVINFFTERILVLRNLWLNIFWIFWSAQCSHSNPVDTGRKLNVHKTFRRSPGRLLNVSYVHSIYVLCLQENIKINIFQSLCWVWHIRIHAL